MRKTQKKIVMFEFCFYYVKPKHDEKAKAGTVVIVVKIKSKIYKKYVL